MAEHYDLREPDASRPDPALLIRTANRYRQKFRPEEIKDLNFEVRSFQHYFNYLVKVVILKE